MQRIIPAVVILFFCVTLSSLAQPVDAAEQAVDEAAAPKPTDPRQSVVRIYSTIRYPQLYRPWAKSSPSQSTGTGFLVEAQDGEKLVLTNQHVIGWASQIYVQPYQTSQRLRAELVVCAPDFDLALLRLREPEAVADRPALTFASELPDVRDTVSVYGYPEGGDELSVTKGIVSRIEVAGYDQNAVGLRLQVDAALNPGNSGGPALIDDEVVGVAFQVNSAGENIGYLIPVAEVRRFLGVSADGTYDPKPSLNLSYQTTENPSLRQRLGLSPQQIGVMVNNPEAGYPDLPSHTQLQNFDIITHIGPHALDNHGQVDIGPDLRGHFSYYVEFLSENGTVPLTVLRDGQPVELREPLTPQQDMLMPFLGDGYPRYFIFGPMVFTQATREFYSFANENYVPVLGLVNSPLVSRLFDRKKFAGEEMVCVASSFFPHPMTRDYDDPMYNVVGRVNGVPIKNLEHLIQVINESEDEFLQFDFAEESSEWMVFNRQEMKDSTEEILNDNGIRYPSSEDLRDLVESYDE